MGSKISLCMIVKDEEENLRRCLSSVYGAVDEIIVVDTGSSDGTPGVAAEFGARVLSFPWNGNFSDARNASLEGAGGDWILFLDADEEMTPEGKEALRRVTANETAEGWFIKVINYLGQEGWVESCPDLIFRLFRNQPEYRFHGAIHEQIVDVILEKNSRAAYRTAEDMVILHYGYLNRQIEEKDKKNRNLNMISRELAARPDSRLLRYHYGVELFRAERYREAADELIRAASGIDPGTIYLPKLLRYLVLTYQALGLPEKALETVRLGLSLFPDYADLYYYGGLICYEQKDYSGAYQLVQQALSMPDQPAYYAPFSGTRGFRALYQLGRLAEAFFNEEEAMNCYVRSLQDNSGFTPALESITRLLKPREDPEYARKCLEQLCEFCTPQANLLMGQVLFRQSAYQLALEYLERGAGEPEAPAEMLLWKGICLIQQRRFLEALRILNGFKPGHQMYPLATLNKILCFWARGNRSKVRSLADDLFALGLSPDTGAVVSLLKNSLAKRRGPGLILGEEGFSLLLDIVTRALDMGEADRARSLLEGLTRDLLIQHSLTLGKLFLLYGSPDHAEEYLIMRLEFQPRCAEAHFTLAEIKERRGEKIEAARWYRQALTLDPREPRHHICLIRHYEKMRRELLGEALQRYPDTPILRELLEEEAR